MIRFICTLAGVACFTAAAFSQVDSSSTETAVPFEKEGERARSVAATQNEAAAQTGMDRALTYLVESQNEDGSWASGAIEGLLDTGYSVASFYDWQVAAHCLAVMALAECEETPARKAALDRGIRWLCESRLPRRGSDWDNDTMWPALYGLVVMTKLVTDPRYMDSPLSDAMETRGREFLKLLIHNQVPTGGWGYYDDAPYTRIPKWGTSFCTALIIPALERAENLSWLEDMRVRERAIAYVRRCALPNGAYEYDLRPIPRAPMGESINQIKGSLGRIQVCNWSLYTAKDPSVDLDEIREGLRLFFEDHKFLDLARMRPVPHEAYYANAGYFYFFGHYYAALAINLLPEDEREAWHAQMRPQITKTQRKDGSMCDFLGQRYLIVADTAYGAMTLNEGLAGSRP